MGSEPQENIVPIDSEARAQAQKFGAEHNRELLTILFTDLVDSTQLQQELGNEEAARLSEMHRHIVRTELAKYDAREIEWAGDSCLAVFTKPSDAVTFALRMQAAHRQARETEPQLPHVRVGIHLGEIEVHHQKGGDKDDLFGIQVSEAARIMSLADGGQVYCSRAVYDNARATLRGKRLDVIGNVAFANHGAFLLKGVAEPVEICEVLDADIVEPKSPAANDKSRPVRSAPHSRTHNLARAAALIVVFVALAFGAGWWLDARKGGGPDTGGQDFAPAEPPQVRSFVLALPSDRPLAPPDPVVARSLDVSPDGKTIAYRSLVRDENCIVLQKIGSLDSTVVEGSIGANRQKFSPNGRWLAAYGIVNGARKLTKFPVNGGAPQAVADMAINFPVAWADDTHIVYTTDYGQPLYIVSAEGGEPTHLTTLEEGAQGHAFPVPLPGGKGIVFTSYTVPTIDGAAAMVFTKKTGLSHPVLEHAGSLGYLANGYLILAQVGRLVALPFDFDTLEATGTPFDVTEQRMVASDTTPTRVAVSSAGTLVYVPIDLDETDALTLVWVSADGKEEPLDIPPDRYVNHAVSPDGRFAAVTISNGDFNSIWLLDIERGVLSRLTYQDESPYDVVWLPNSQEIVFMSTRTGGWALHRLNVFRPQERELLVKASGGDIWPESVSPDGSELIYGTATGAAKLHALPLREHGESRPILDGPGSRHDAHIAPNGRWIAYASDESGRKEVYLQTYPEPGRKRQISTRGGKDPQWSVDGKTLYFLDNSSEDLARFVAVSIEFEPELRIGEPSVFAEGPYHGFQHALDGTRSRFLVAKRLSRDGVRIGGTELIVVENWQEKVKRADMARREQ